MLLFHSLFAFILLAFAGGARGSTPPGTVPSNSDDLTATFGNLLATNGASVTTTEAKEAPVIGLSKAYSNASFTVFMVDIDAKFLHWAQTGLSTSSPSMTVKGTTFYPLENSAGVRALQAYIMPNPPAGAAHRYTQYLMVTTNMSDLVVSQAVATAIRSRVGLNVSQLFSETGRTLLASNWWNTSKTVTSNTTTSSNSSNSSITVTSANAASGYSFKDIMPLLSALGGLAALFSLL